MQEISPVAGWSLNAVVELDRHKAGVAGAFLRASPERRQVISALLAAKSLPRDPVEVAALADVVVNADHRSILALAFGSVPSGLRGALRRSGYQPHARAYYKYLYRLLSRPKHGRIVTTIAQLNQIDFIRLGIVERLPEDVCSASLAVAIANPAHARDVAAMVALLTDNGVDRRSLAEALRGISSENELAALWERWALKAKFPPHPLKPSDLCAPIRSGRELHRMALRYRNCARSYLSKVLSGNDAFAEFVGRRSSRIIIHLRRFEGRWTVEGFFGRDNLWVANEDRAVATDYLAELGIRERPKPSEPKSEWEVLRRLTRDEMLEFGIG